MSLPLPFEDLVRTYSDKVLNLIYRMIGDRYEAEDLCQEVFVRAYRAYPSFRGDSSVHTWLYRIAANLCLDVLRRRKRTPSSVPLQDVADRLDGTGASPLEEAESKDLSRTIMRCLMSLPPAQRGVLVLHDVEGMKYEEIAKVMACSLGTVKSRLFYGRRELRKALSDVMSDPDLGCDE